MCTWYMIGRHDLRRRVAAHATAAGGTRALGEDAIAASLVGHVSPWTEWVEVRTNQRTNERW